MASMRSRYSLPEIARPVSGWMHARKLCPASEKVAESDWASHPIEYLRPVQHAGWTAWSILEIRVRCNCFHCSSLPLMLRAAPVPLNSNLQIRLILNTPNATGSPSIRIAKDPRNNDLYYSQIQWRHLRITLQPGNGTSPARSSMAPLTTAFPIAHKAWPSARRDHLPRWKFHRRKQHLCEIMKGVRKAMAHVSGRACRNRPLSPQPHRF